MTAWRYVERLPSARFARVVLAYWEFQSPASGDGEVVHDVWPDGCASLSVIVEQDRVAAVTVTGPCVRARRFAMPPGQRVFGLRCWPDAAECVLGVAASALRNRVLPASAVFDGDTSRFGDSILASGSDTERDRRWEAWLTARGVAAEPNDAPVRAVVERLVSTNGAASIAEAAESVGLGIRQLERRFGASVGITPKQFARVRRVRAAIGLLLERPRSWSELAADVGFSDQSHLAREIRDITGLAPGMLVARLQAIRHVGVRV